MGPDYQDSSLIVSYPAKKLIAYEIPTMDSILAFKEGKEGTIENRRIIQKMYFGMKELQMAAVGELVEARYGIPTHKVTMVIIHGGRVKIGFRSLLPSEAERITDDKLIIGIYLNSIGKLIG